MQNVSHFSCLTRILVPRATASQRERARYFSKHFQTNRKHSRKSPWLMYYPDANKKIEQQRTTALARGASKQCKQTNKRAKQKINALRQCFWFLFRFGWAFHGKSISFGMHKYAKRFGPRNFGRKTNECTLKSCHNKTSIEYFFCSRTQQIAIGAAAAATAVAIDWSILFWISLGDNSRFVVVVFLFCPIAIQMWKTFHRGIPLMQMPNMLWFFASFEIRSLCFLSIKQMGFVCHCQHDQKIIDFSFTFQPMDMNRAAVSWHIFEYFTLNDCSFSV